jgi:hypothetical protein
LRSKLPPPTPHLPTNAEIDANNKRIEENRSRLKKDQPYRVDHVCN